MARNDERIKQAITWLVARGESVDAALSEAVLRSMGGTTLYAALESVCDDVRDGTWPEGASGEIVGESWASCEFCEDEFLPQGPGDWYCSETCRIDDGRQGL